MSFQFTRITSQQPSILSKYYELRSGELVKEVSAHMTSGIAMRRSIDTFQAFSRELEMLQTSDALAYGITRQDVGQIITKGAYEKLPQGQRTNYITRTNDDFSWPAGPAILMIDIDPPTGGEALSREAVLELLTTVCPMLRDVPKIWLPSSSSHIFTTCGTDLTGLRGQRIYMPVLHGTEIPQITDAIWTRLWAAGHGFVRISKSGARLKSTPFDATVYQPSRLDFAAGAATGPGLIQKRGNPEYIK